MPRLKNNLRDTLSTFSQTEVTVQPSAEKPSTVTSAIFAEEVPAIPSTSKQIHLEIPASSSDSNVSHPSHGTSASQTGLTLFARTPRKQRLRRALQKQKEKSSQKEESMEKMVMQFNHLSEKLLPPNLVTIVKTQVTLNQQNRSQLRYSNEYKQFALHLFFLSPMAYRFLRTTFFLPTIRTLQRLTEKVVINPGINAIVFNIMKLKAKHFSSEALECVICADEMSIKSNLYYDIGADEIIGFHQVGDKKEFLPANNVLAIMARGIFENWKQPIAYVYVNTTCNSNELKKLIFDAVGELRKINFKVRALSPTCNFVKFNFTF
jgi:hypothetical protein